MGCNYIHSLKIRDIIILQNGGEAAFMIVGKPSILKNGNDVSFTASFTVVATPEGEELCDNKDRGKSNTKKNFVML